MPTVLTHGGNGQCDLALFFFWRGSLVTPTVFFVATQHHVFSIITALGPINRKLTHTHTHIYIYIYNNVMHDIKRNVSLKVIPISQRYLPCNKFP